MLASRSMNASTLLFGLFYRNEISYENDLGFPAYGDDL